LSVTNNRLRGSKWGFGIQLTDNEQPSVIGGNLTIKNNLLYNEKPVDPNPQFVTIYAGHDVTVQHNTSLQSGAMWFSDRWPITNFVYKDNISLSGRYGPSCFLAPGTLQTCWPSVVTSSNAVVDNRDDRSTPLAIVIPGSNYYPASIAAIGFVDIANGNYRLASQSQLRGKGSNGSDPGVDMDRLIAALAGSSTAEKSSK
jgi:hypothetical protein